MASTPLPHTDTLEIRGHIIDSMLFTRILDQVLEARASYRIERFDVGRTPVDPSYARLQICTDDPERLEELVQSLMGLGMQRLETGDATLVDDGEVAEAAVDHQHGGLPDRLGEGGALPAHHRPAHPRRTRHRRRHLARHAADLEAAPQVDRHVIGLAINQSGAHPVFRIIDLRAV